MKDKVLRRQWLPTRPSGIKHVCSNTITQCYEEQRRDPSQAAQHLVSRAETDHEGVMSRIVLAELVLYIEETHLEEGTAPVFRLADLAKLYTTRMEHLGVALCTKVNITRLKERLLAQLPSLFY